jgi:hypothetical protein
MKQAYIAKLSALTSAHLTELAESLPETDELRADLLQVSERIDARFGLVTVRCPIERE